MRHLLSKTVSTLLLLATTSCATMRDSTHQPVLVNSRPSGATVTADERVVGTTPTFVDLSRRGRHELRVRTATGAEAVRLTKHYRWRASFWPNLIWLMGAPVAWLVDLATGAAFEYDPVEFPRVELARADLGAVRPHRPRYVVAPPRADEPGLSDAGGEALEAWLRRRGVDVVPYKETLPAFIREGYDFDGAPAEHLRGPLYRDLAADVVTESTLVKVGDRMVVRARDNHVFERRVTKGEDVEIEASSDFDRVFTVDRWWSRLLPNTAALDFAVTRTYLETGGQTYVFTPPESEGFAAQALDYLSAFKITSLPARRLQSSARWSLGLVPTIRASRREVTVPLLPGGQTDADEDLIYTRWLLGAGYGPELGLQFGRNYVYFDLLPVVVFSSIDTEGLSTRSWTVQLSVELGYLLYLTQNWNARLFVRNQNEDSSLWRRALGDRLGADQSGATITSAVSGLSIGYRFAPSALARAR